MLRILLAIFIFIGIGSAYHLYTTKETPMIIPRKVLFDNPDHTTVRLSPDGKWLSYLAPNKGVLNIWVKELTTGKIKVVTEEKKRGIRTYGWAYDNQHLLYVQDQDGDENWQLHKVNVKTNISTILTPEKGVHTTIIKTSHLHPTQILIGLNSRDPVYHDIYLLDIETGEKKLILENREFSYDGIIADDNFNIILARKMNDKAEHLYYKLNQKEKTLYRIVALEDSLTTAPLGLDASNEWMYWMDSENTDKTNLVKIHLKTKEKQIIANGKQADIDLAIFHPLTKETLVVGENYLRRTLTFLAKDVEEDFNILRNVAHGEINIASSNLEYTKWVVAFTDDRSPVRYYLYDRLTKKADFLFCNKKEWVGLPFVSMEPIEIQSRDGLTLVSYLHRPSNIKPGIPLPMILYVHGGPIARNEWGMSSLQQWLANRGYAVLSVNFRGSTGFGKSFIQASYGEWGRKMHDDLIDATNWAIKEGIAEPQKICILGGSYGGYAALVGATMTPDVFACAIDIVGPSNLITLLETIPPYWRGEYELLKVWVGADPATEKGKAFLKTRSPLTFIDNIRKPLLIIQGANDPRVKKAESDQIVNAMQHKNIPVTYLLFPDEGHGCNRPENNLAYKAAIEVFLQQQLGGLAEPLGNEIKESTMQIVSGQITN